MPSRVMLSPESPVWFYSHNHNGEYTQGVIDGIYHASDGFPIYIIRVDTHIDPVYHVRDFLEVSDSPQRPIGLWRGSDAHKEKMKKMRQELDAKGSPKW